MHFDRLTFSKQRRVQQRQVDQTNNMGIAKTKANGEKIIAKPGDKKGFTNKKDKSGKIRKGTDIRTQNEVTDDESEDEDKSFLAERGDSEEEE